MRGSQFCLIGIQPRNYPWAEKKDFRQRRHSRRSSHFGRDIEEGGFRFEHYGYPNGSKIELLEPLHPDSFVAKFLRERGEGLHHLTFKVVHLEELVEKLKKRGYRIVGENYERSYWKEALISPRHAMEQLFNWPSRISPSNYKDSKTGMLRRGKAATSSLRDSLPSR